MNIHDILLTVQYITISVLFIEVLIVFLRWKNPIHSYLFLACISSFISNIGYLFELKALSEETYISALKLSYVGRVWIVFALFLFSAKMCKIKIPRGLLYFLLLLHLGIYLSILTIGSNALYYTEYQFIPDPEFPRFIHSNGYLHDLLMGLNAVLISFSMGWVIREYRREDDKRSKQRLFMLILAFGVQALAFLLQVTGLVGISDYFDLTMPGALFGTVFMLIGILGFDLLGAREIAKDFAIDRISEGIIAVDNGGRIQYYNEPAARIYPEFDTFFSIKRALDIRSARREDTEGSGEGEMLPSRAHTPYDILDHITEAINKGEILKVGDRVYTPEENDLMFKGESYGKLYALVDDTDRYHYMEELQKQRDIADSANEAKSRFLASMSHEIRTPINAMLGMDEMILREAEDKTIRSYATDIMGAGRTLLSLVNDILDLSKVEEGKMEIIPVQYDLASLINDLANMTRERAAKKGLKFAVKADEHIPHLLYGDEIRIRQCAMNLLTNAVKYTESGEVRFRITYSKKDKDHILLSFTVEDTGIGMKEEDMVNLFSPYKRIEEKRNRAIEGTGLGMSITRQLLELMGSSLQVHSEYGKGSVFSFTIDQEVIDWEELGEYSLRFDEAAAQSYEYHELFHAPDARILVVDDTEMNLTVITSLLKKTEIRIDTAASGKEALDKAEDTRYDVIFIDHMMPDMDGIETLKHLRESGKCTDVPAVALTANAVSGAREMYLEAGFTNYLSKPVDGERLERMLSELIADEKLLKPENTPGKEETVSGEDTASTQLPVWLEDIEGIDVQAGLKNCGSIEGYISVLSVFHGTARSKAEEIEKLFGEGDIENYTIKVHALKSSARIIGASALSELAKSLEDAGKRKDSAYIRENTERLLEQYRSLDDRLSGLDETKEERPSIDAAALKEAYQTVIEIAGSMDYGLMESLLKDLRGYALPDKDRKKLTELEEKLNGLDWDGMIKIAREEV
ncbi:MAG: response regulator [Lachnospiraceae bacterium]|nr:response regulator [Lachnospiraceae bacterium]